MRSETQISEQLDERLTMNGNKRYYKLILINKNFNDFTYHNYSNTQMKVYAKNSFDRFGDDLTELILQYLTFEDKVRLECVSKQWRRLVYNKQFVIEGLRKGSKNFLTHLYPFKEIHKFSIDKHWLESLLKKCPNIIEFNPHYGNNGELLPVIGQYCHRIKSLKYYSNIVNDDNVNHVLSFFRMYGHKLEELDLFSGPETEQVLKLCPNLKKIIIDNPLVLYNTDKDYLPKIQHIVTRFINDNIQMKILSDKYSKTLKSFNAWFMYGSRERVIRGVNCISEFENLKELKLEFMATEIREPIDDCFILIGQKCSKLLKLDLNFNFSFYISDRFYNIFSEFKAIKKLKLHLPEGKVLSGSVECFEHCKQLYEIIIYHYKLTEDFFINIETFVPNLRHLYIETRKQFSDTFISNNSFQTMEYIQRVRLIVHNYEERKVHKKFWYFNKALSDRKGRKKWKTSKDLPENCGLIAKDHIY